MPGRRRVAAAIPGGIAVLAVTSTVIGLLLFLDNRAGGGANRSFDPVMPVTAIAFPAAAAFITCRRPEVRVGWVMFAGALVAVAFLAEQYGVQALETRPGELPGGQAMAWLGGWLWAPGYLVLWTLLPLLFPDGHPPSPRWRPLLWAAGALVALTTVLAMVTAGGTGTAGPAGTLHAAGVFMLTPLCWTALLSRYLGGDTEQRRRLEWPLRATGIAVAVPLAVVVAGLVLGAWVPLPVYQVAAALALASVPVATVVAIVHHRLYRLDAKADSVVNRLIVHLVLTVLGTAAFLAVLGLLEAATDGPRLAQGIAALVVAVVSALWLRSGLERIVDRFVYRRRRYDYRVLSSLGRILRTTLGTDVLLPTVVDSVATGLRLPYVAVTVGQGDGPTVASASSGHAGGPDDLLVLPLVHQGEPVGRLTVAPRGPKEPFDASDRRLLADVAGQVAVVAFALCLTADLQRSRERLVSAREEERSRLRRDLHDGLQPALSGVLLGLDAARNILGRSGGADELLARLRTELESAAGDVRRLVYGLRPPALDELGLAGALRQQATMFTLSPSTPEVVVTAPDELEELPAAVEVAAYRISQEALENVRKHASARTCEIVLSTSGAELRVDVQDDGRGIASDAAGGVGLRAMRERAAELGGTCTVESSPGAGTRVHAVLPLARRR